MQQVPCFLTLVSGLLIKDVVVEFWAYFASLLIAAQFPIGPGPMYVYSWAQQLLVSS